ncbi:MAG: NFACT RNA binding domain-containing protein [Clostridiales bacterium]|nr:NFACT RNA binding domain-containing protein [Clostridiales bacterium]
MAFDGTVISNLVYELDTTLTGGRIVKIAQPENDALLFTIKNNGRQYRLFASADASLPLLYLTDTNKPSPMTAPNFCMLLRKHLNSARILSVTQPGLERIVDLTIEHLNEMGDTCKKHLMIELMGKHSNIIFCDDENHIVDSIKHISGLVSSVREVLPGRDYFIPETQHKENPLTITQEQFLSVITSKAASIGKAIYTSLTGISPLMANEICCRASIESDRAVSSLTEAELLHLSHNFERFVEDILSHSYQPVMIMEESTPCEYASFPLALYPKENQKPYESISALLSDYYSMRDTITRIRQKSSDLRRIVNTALERVQKKKDIQEKQLKDTEKRDKFKIYGEMLTTYGYELKEGARELECVNYYTNEPIRIPLDPAKNAMENARHYFDKYNKLKRTNEAVTIQLKETCEELEHLESISNALDIALVESDLVQLRQELTDYGYLKYHNHGDSGKKKSRKEKVTSKPLHYRSSDGYDIYVGKNNYQNDELTFHFASGNDWWFHAKGMAGSHVIVKSQGEELPDRVFEEAAALAAYYSKGREMGKVEIDYVEKKQVKKPNGSKPGFVIYYTNYSMIATPDISSLTQVE